MEAANVFARIVLEQTRPTDLQQEMRAAHLRLYCETPRSVLHEARLPTDAKPAEDE